MIFSPFGFRNQEVGGVAPTPTPTSTPTPSSTSTPTPTPTQTLTSTPTPTPTLTPTATTLPFSLSGITLYLDAGNSSSYPGSGTTWYDLSGNGNHGTLNNGPTYSSSNGGSIVFDGVNDYVSFASVSNMPTGNTAYTIIAFIKKDTASRRDGMIGYGTFGNTRQYLGFRTLGPPFETEGLVTYWYGSDFSVTTTVNSNTWYGMVSRFNKTSNQREMFINNSSIGTNSPSGTLNVQPQSGLLVGMTNIGNGLDDYIDGNMSVMMVYNRSLSDSELTSIWDYFKGRYGY
jgi:hypothetical protein